MLNLANDTQNKCESCHMCQNVMSSLNITRSISELILRNCSQFLVKTDLRNIFKNVWYITGKLFKMCDNNFLLNGNSVDKTFIIEIIRMDTFLGNIYSRPQMEILIENLERPRQLTINEGFRAISSVGDGRSYHLHERCFMCASQIDN